MTKLNKKSIVHIMTCHIFFVGLKLKNIISGITYLAGKYCIFALELNDRCILIKNHEEVLCN